MWWCWRRPSSRGSRHTSTSMALSLNLKSNRLPIVFFLLNKHVLFRHTSTSMALSLNLKSNRLPIVVFLYFCKKKIIVFIFQNNFGKIQLYFFKVSMCSLIRKSEQRVFMWLLLCSLGLSFLWRLLCSLCADCRRHILCACLCVYVSMCSMCSSLYVFMCLCLYEFYMTFMCSLCADL